MESWFDDDWATLDAEVQTNLLSFGDPAQIKTFDFVDIIGRKQEGWEIAATIYNAEGEAVWGWEVTDLQLNINWSTVVLWASPLGKKYYEPEIQVRILYYIHSLQEYNSLREPAE